MGVDAKEEGRPDRRARAGGAYTGWCFVAGHPEGLLPHPEGPPPSRSKDAVGRKPEPDAADDEPNVYPPW